MLQQQAFLNFNVVLVLFQVVDPWRAASYTDGMYVSQFTLEYPSLDACILKL